MAMATPSDAVDASVLTSATTSGAMDDGRGFTTAGTGHLAPDFESISPAPYKRTTNKKTSKRRAQMIPVPRVVVSPEELDLEDTLVEGQSFLSSGSSSHCAEFQYSESISTGNSTSYSRAVSRGRLNTSNSVRQLAEIKMGACVFQHSGSCMLD